MGCSSSRGARGDVDMPVPRRDGKQPPVRAAAAALGSIGGRRRGGKVNGLRACSELGVEGTVKGGGGEAAGWYAELSSAASSPSPRHGSRALMRGLLEVLEDDGPSDTSSMANWPASSSSSSAESPLSLGGSAGESPPPPPLVRSDPVFDPAVMSGLRRDTVVAPSPSHPELLFPEKDAQPPPEEPLEDDDDDNMMPLTPAARDIPQVTGLVRARVMEFHLKMEAKRKMKQQADGAPDAVAGEPEPPRPRAVVVYFTSIRGVRRTFEDSRAVRAILSYYHVRVDERDLSMHAGFKDELRGLLGEGRPLSLPLVFVPGAATAAAGEHAQPLVYLGSFDDVRALHEDGELAGALAGCDPLAGGAHVSCPCAGCGDMRFLLCETCNGSCKLFAGDEGSIFQRCPDCNENGLIRCPVCSL